MKLKKHKMPLFVTPNGMLTINSDGNRPLDVLRPTVTKGNYHLITPPPLQVFDQDIALKFLDVERNPAFKPANGKTYCNIYAHKLCAMLGVWIPRVFWRDYTKIKVGAPYLPQLFELSANELCNFVVNYHENYPEWELLAVRTGKETFSTTDFGRVSRMGLLLARSTHGSGHVSVLLRDAEGKLFSSQAGAKNMQADYLINWIGLRFESKLLINLNSKLQ